MGEKIKQFFGVKTFDEAYAALDAAKEDEKKAMDAEVPEATLTSIVSMLKALEEKVAGISGAKAPEMMPEPAKDTAKKLRTQILKCRRPTQTRNPLPLWKSACRLSKPKLNL